MTHSSYKTAFGPPLGLILLSNGRLSLVNFIPGKTRPEPF